LPAADTPATTSPDASKSGVNAEAAKDTAAPAAEAAKAAETPEAAAKVEAAAKEAVK
jgi:hypothetical protein